MSLAWRTVEGGFVEVEGRGVRRAFGPEVARCWQKWQAPISANEARLTLPRTMILATMAVESGGNENAKGTSGEVGLMQLMPINWRGLSAAQVAVPATNIQIGSEMLATYWFANGAGDGVPRVASCYNAGSEANLTPHPRASDPWGMVESAGYIDKIVAAYNEAIAQMSGTAPGANSSSSSSSSSEGMPLPVIIALGKFLYDEFGGGR